MTVWLAAQHDVWKAAVASAAPIDLFDQYAASDLNTFFGLGLNGSPWGEQRRANYLRQSPISYAHRIRAPTLVISTADDARVPVISSYKLYHALSDSGTPVQFIIYPSGGHFPGGPVQQRDFWRRWAEWIELQFRTTS